MDWLTGGDRHHSARERIYDAAAALVASQGLERLKIDDVAVNAGCSRATVYRHVGGKDDIRDAVMVRVTRRVIDSVTVAVESKSGEERMVASIMVTLTTLRADPAFADVGRIAPTARMLEQTLIGSPRVPAAAAEIAGLPPDDDLAAMWMVRVVLALMYWPVPDTDGFDESVVRRFVVPMFTRT